MEKDSTVKIAMASPRMDGEWDTAKALGTAEAFARQAASLGAAAVCFPEAFLTGYVPSRVRELAVVSTGEETRKLSALAETTGIDILCGFMERITGGYRVTHGIFRPDGGCDFYSKSHLGETEKAVFLPGNSIGVYPLSCGLRAGFQLCVELHVPEMTQSLSRQGADIIFCPHSVPGSPEKRKSVWEKLVSARGYDSRCYIACCNDRRSSHEGGIAAADPEGSLLLSAFGKEDCLEVFEADPDLLGRFRSSSQSMSDRYYPSMARKELYT
ncbi:MAG: hypothetical protein J5822_06745 [Eubacteriaceae bacterium]|nr:hypothetical protein [Eubacteriaceae bacterium]